MAEDEPREARDKARTATITGRPYDLEVSRAMCEDRAKVVIMWNWFWFPQARGGK